MSTNLNHELKKRGFNPIVKYKTLKESMRNPLFNPYLAMVSDPVSLNHLMATHSPLQAMAQLKTVRNMASIYGCLLYTSPSPRDLSTSRMPSSA